MSLGKPAKMGISILLLVVLGAGFQITEVRADVANIVNLAYRTVGSAAWLDMTVRHGGPSSIHYVSSVQLEVNGTVQDLAQTPQSTENFIVSYNLGSSSNRYSVRARPLCNIHGGTWSTLTVVPELSLYAMLLFLALATAAIIIVRKAPYLRRNARTF